MLTKNAWKGFSIFFFLSGAFYLIMFEFSLLKEDVIDIIFTLIFAAIMFFTSFYVLYEMNKEALK